VQTLEANARGPHWDWVFIVISLAALLAALNGMMHFVS